ncbi:MAG: hypothetical protein WC829_04455 [Hyphomicrobium sp.]|jgi:hypothetical protein
MADAATAGQGIERPNPDLLDPDIAEVTPTEDGGAIVNFDGPQPEAPAELAFDDDLTPLLTPEELNGLGTQICQFVDEDERSRADWRKSYARGLNLLGLNYEERTEPWEGACGAYHPMLLESVIRFNAQAMMDMFPGAGPVKTQIVGRITDEKERQADRVRTDMNWLAAEKIKGYRAETDMMLFNLPLAGTTFRKFRYDKRRKVPAAEYVLPEHVVMPYSAASLDSADRYTIILPMTSNRIEALMAEGFYRTVKVGKGVVVTTDISEQKDKIEGKSNSNTADDALHRLYETHINWWLKSDPLVSDNQPHPYVITVDSVSHQVLSVRRNWREGDETMERQIDVVQHKYMPGFGPYGIGLINILGGLTESATSILRQLVDAGVLSNIPAGYKTKQARIKDDSSPVGPGEWRDVEVGSGTLKESFFPLPYKEPSQVLLALLGVTVDEGRRIGSVADMKITDMTGQNMPVGTTLAIIERSMKVMSAVQQRLYESFKNEFRVIAEIVHDFMGKIPYKFELDQRDAAATREVDYDDRIVSVIPVADPNATTMAQRIMVMQSVIQLTQTAPQIYNLPNVHRDMITVLGSDKADFYIPPPEDVLPRDPVTENMDILNSRPVKAGLMQDHKAHIAVHMAAAEDPKLVAMLTNNPSAPAIMAAANAHILEHLAFQYREDIEEQLGVQLPPPGEPLPEDVEYQLSRLASAAAAKLLDKSKAEQQQKDILEKLEDPVIQNETRALEIKDKEAETKRLKVLADADADKADRIKDILLAIFKEMSETERSTLAAEIQKGAMASEEQMRTAELASDLGQGMMGKIADLLTARLKTDVEKARIAAKPKAAA